MSRQGIELAMPMPAQSSRAPNRAASGPAAGTQRSWRKTLAIAAAPLAAIIALAVHAGLPNRALALPTHSYPVVLVAILIFGMFGALVQVIWPGQWRWFSTNAPLLAAATLTMAAWELITLKLALMPIVYFPPPEAVFQTLIDDRAQLFDSTWHSLLLLLIGYVAGAICGLVSGITIGWSTSVRYWGMPILKIVGPIPATAWIPLTLIIFPQSNLAGIALIALAVWFPVTMLAASGVSNTRASYLDVARTLGAGRAYLIFRVAIPAAMPSIFIGLFMGLGASFLTLLVAESTGVRSGLGWYIDWARNYSDYAKVFAALVIMAAFFSTIMTVLFKARDRVLVWQKGTIKW